MNKDFISLKQDDKDDSLIKSWIRHTLTGEVLYLVSGLSTGKEVLKSLEKAFVQDTRDRERSLFTRLHNCKKDTFSISNYLKRFECICNELTVIQKSNDNDDKVIQFVGLGPKYYESIDSQLSKPPFSTSSQFISVVTNHELRISSYEEKKAIDHNLAFVGVKGGRGRGRDRGRRGSSWPPNFNSKRHGFIPYGQQCGSSNTSSSTQAFQHVVKNGSPHLVSHMDGNQNVSSSFFLANKKKKIRF